MKLAELIVECSEPMLAIRAMTDLYPSIATVPERRKVNRVLLSYLARYGEEGLWSRVNGKSLAQIVEEFNTSELPGVVEEEGEVSGVKYTLIRHEGQDDSTSPTRPHGDGSGGTDRKSEVMAEDGR